MEASMNMEASEFPTLADIISVQTVDVVQNVVVTDQLKRALDFCFTAITDLQRPDRAATPDDVESLRNELKEELAELKAAREAEREASEEASAAQQEAFTSQLQELKDQQTAAAEQVQELRDLAEELQEKASQLTADHELNVGKLEEVQEAINEQRQLVVSDIKAVHARVTNDLKESVASSQEAVKSLLDETSAIRQEVQEARNDAVQQVAAVEDQLKTKEEEFAMQKLADLQSADDIITTRMAAANVEGLARAVAALSRESARADATIRELQAVQQDLRAQLTGKAGVNELQAVAQRRGSKPGGVAADGSKLSARGETASSHAPQVSFEQSGGVVDGGYSDAQFALMHERITNKGDADEVTQIQKDVAILKRAIGASLLAQQQNPTSGGPSLQDDMDKLLERMRKLESTLGAQEVVSAIMRRSASAKGVKLPSAALAPSLLNPDAADESAVVDAVTAISKVNDADLKGLEIQIKTLKGKIARSDGELSGIKGVVSYLQTELLRKADVDEVTKLKVGGLLSLRSRKSFRAPSAPVGDASPSVSAGDAGAEGNEEAGKDAVEHATGELVGDATDPSGAASPKAVQDVQIDEQIINDADKALIEEVTHLVTGLASRKEVDVVQQRLDDKTDQFTVQSLQEDVQELQEEIDAAKRGIIRASPSPQAADNFSFSTESSPSKHPNSSTLNNTQALSNPTPHNTMERPGQFTNSTGAGTSAQATQPTLRSNMLEYVASVLSRRNTTEVNSGQLAGQGSAQRVGGSSDPVQALLSAKLAPQDSHMGAEVTSYETIVAHQQALGAHVQRLTDELAKLRRNNTTSRRSDGDHTLLSRKPLTGYICMACDRPLGKLSQNGMPSVPTKKMSHQVQMEYIPAHGVVPSEAVELRTHREASGVVGNRWSKSPPKVAPNRKTTIPAGTTPAIDQPRAEVGPTIGQGGWKSQHPYGVAPSASGTSLSRPGTAFVSGRRGT